MNQLSKPVYVVSIVLVLLGAGRGRPMRIESSAPPKVGSTEDLLRCSSESEIGQFGGNLVFAQRSEPKTLNPLIASDGSSKQIIALITADLIHINRYTQGTECALARSWEVSASGMQYTLHLRRGLRFSDGQPFDADDVIFSFRAYLDARIQSPQRDLLTIAGKPITFYKLDPNTIRFELARPYAAAERIFDSVAILPRHLLEKPYEGGHLTQVWGLNTPPREMAGLGPFRVKEYVPGQRLVLERNPYFWKTDAKGNRLPYLNQLIALFVGNADAQAVRFASSDIDVADRLSASSFLLLQKDQRTRGFRLYNLGPGLEYSFLFFNLNQFDTTGLSAIREKQDIFRQVAFRRAVSVAIDRKALVRLAYHGLAYPSATFVTPGNKLWVNHAIPEPVASADTARQILRDAGFSWTEDGHLRSPEGKTVEFTIAHSATDSQYAEMAALIQRDLEQIGMTVKVVPLDFHALLDRVFRTFNYEAVILSLLSGDTDPNSEINVWRSGGATHLWDLSAKPHQPQWQQEIDRLLSEQMVALDYKKRKSIYDTVQLLIWKNVPIICLVSQNVLIAAKQQIGNFRPAILSDHTLWNAEQLFLRPGQQLTLR